VNLQCGTAVAEPWKPHAGQKKAVKFLIEHAAAALLADPGVGKTSCVYAAFKFLKKAGVASRMLVIAPLRPAQLVWPAEQQKWSDFKDLRVVVLHGKDKDRLLYSGADVCVVNPDGLDWLLGAKRTTTAGGRVQVTADLRAFKKLGFDTLCIDELPQFKSTSSGRFKALRAVRETFSRIWGLTGTPAPNGLIDLFGQALILDGGRTFGPYVTHFRNQYFVPSYDGFSWKLQKDAEERIYERMRPLALRLEASDYIDMPALVENVVRFDLPPAVQKFYDKLEAELIAEIESNVVVAGNAAAASTKLRQVVNGGVYLDDIGAIDGYGKSVGTVDGRKFAQFHDAKTDLLEDLIAELQGTPLLLFYEFQHDLERIKRRFGKDVPSFSGATEKQAQRLEAAWNRGELPLLCGNAASVGHGLNLQNAGNHVCWYSPPWRRDLLDQGNGRVRRQGSRHQTVFVHYLTARGTIDEIILGALRSKARVQDALLKAMKNNCLQTR
jgi:SNF2 family DNA or RNA helicase